MVLRTCLVLLKSN